MLFSCPLTHLPTALHIARNPFSTFHEKSSFVLSYTDKVHCPVLLRSQFHLSFSLLFSSELLLNHRLRICYPHLLSIYLLPPQSPVPEDHTTKFHIMKCNCLNWYFKLVHLTIKKTGIHLSLHTSVTLTVNNSKHLYSCYRVTMLGIVHNRNFASCALAPLITRCFSKRSLLLSGKTLLAPLTLQNNFSFLDIVYKMWTKIFLASVAWMLAYLRSLY